MATENKKVKGYVNATEAALLSAIGNNEFGLAKDTRMHVLKDDVGTAYKFKSLTGLTDNRLLKVDGTEGIQQSGIWVGDSDDVSQVNSLDIDGTTDSTSPTTGSSKNAGGQGIVGSLHVGKRINGSQGATVTAAAEITLGDGNYFVIEATGNLNMDGIATAGWRAGAQVILKIAQQTTGTVSIRHDQSVSSGFAPFLLITAQNVSLVNATGMAIFVYDGSYWTQVTDFIDLNFPS
jgi:hypothetical protein